jgi:hypothetical protein
MKTGCPPESFEGDMAPIRPHDNALTWHEYRPRLKSEIVEYTVDAKREPRLSCFR